MILHPAVQAVGPRIFGGQSAKRRIDFDQRHGESRDPRRHGQPGRSDAGAEISRMVAGACISGRRQ